jgi:type IV pilus assembly protein PilY1
VADLAGLVDAFNDIFINIASVDSVFTATTLPVSTTTQGTFLNQIFVGMFRPDGNAKPRWVGNLKQYQFGVINGALELVDKNNNAAVLAGAGLFKATAESFWTEDSVFFSTLPSVHRPPRATDRMARSSRKAVPLSSCARSTRQGASTRNVYTLSGGSLVRLSPAAGSVPPMVSWIKGENNVTATPPPNGMELFNGSYNNAGTPTPLGTTVVRDIASTAMSSTRDLSLSITAVET